jgi:hypothetical protein
LRTKYCRGVSRHVIRRHTLCNHGVGGSNPSAGTTLKSNEKTPLSGAVFAKFDGGWVTTGSPVVAKASSMQYGRAGSSRTARTLQIKATMGFCDVASLRGELL